MATLDRSRPSSRREAALDPAWPLSPSMPPASTPVPSAVRRSPTFIFPSSSASPRFTTNAGSRLLFFFFFYSPIAVYSLSLNPTSGASGATFTATYSADDGTTTRILIIFIIILSYYLEC